jgi:hypothetical protein
MNLKHQLAVVVAVGLLTSSVTAADLPAALLTPYLEVQSALAADQFAGVAAPAKAIEVAAVALGKDGEKLAASARSLNTAKDIAAARTAFGDLSTELIAYAEKTKSGFRADVKQAYCPMVNKAWLQKDKDIKNPYYGASMLTCGSFKD